MRISRQLAAGLVGNPPACSKIGRPAGCERRRPGSARAWRRGGASLLPRSFARVCRVCKLAKVELPRKKTKKNIRACAPQTAPRWAAPRTAPSTAPRRCLCTLVRMSSVTPPATSTAQRRLSSVSTALRARSRQQQQRQRPALTAALTAAAEIELEVVELARNHRCLSQSSPDAKLIAANLPWYSAEYSPHDVPSFYDVSGLTESPAVFQRTIDVLAARYSGLAPDRTPTAIAGFDARGFIFGPPLALALGLPFVMIRKAGKLPGVLVSSGQYQTEYSTDETVMRLGSVSAGDRVVLVDDLVATGGTAIAGFELVDQLGAEVLEFASVVCLPGLNGIEAIHTHADGKFQDVSIFTLVDDATIGPEMCRDPPPGTPRVMPATSQSR